MNPQMPLKTQQETSTYANISLSETEMLAEWGFTPQEITSLLWLRQWYQTGGSDRAQIVRHLEFLKLLILNGKIEV